MINKELFVPMKIFFINFYVNLMVNTKQVVSPIREINLFKNDGRIKVCITMIEVVDDPRRTSILVELIVL